MKTKSDEKIDEIDAPIKLLYVHSYLSTKLFTTTLTEKLTEIISLCSSL